jgi:sterol desaturase/sphingolipid hydroxylase (fatty acid hydroxylase superfamily)
MPDTVNLPEISILAAPVYIVFIVMEILLITLKKVKGDYETRDASASLMMGLGNVASDLLLALSFGALAYAFLFGIYEARIYTFPITIWAVALCFIIDDLRYYWSHRFSHRVRWFWAAHVVHHSSQHFNLSTALRQPWTGHLTFLFIIKAPLAFIGFHPAVIAFVGSANLFYQFFIHTESVDKLPRWIEAVFNTPSHHRVHHGRNPRYLDSNYAGTLIIWDKMFGTFVPEQTSEPVKYGIVHNLGTFNPIRIAVHEYIAIFKDLFRKNMRWRDRWGYFWGAPGWSHDRSRGTSEHIKQDFVDHYPEQAGTPGLPKRTTRGNYDRP